MKTKSLCVSPATIGEPTAVDLADIDGSPAFVSGVVTHPATVAFVQSRFIVPATQRTP